MADSIERIADELDFIAENVQAMSPATKERKLRNIATRLRALSPAGGDWAASGFIRVGLTNVLVSDELSDFVGRKEVSREVHSMIHEDTRNDPHEFGAGIEDNPKAKYWQQRAAFWRETAKSLGYVPPGEAIAASPQQEPGAVANVRALRSAILCALAELVQLGEPEDLARRFKKRQQWPEELIERKSVIDVVLRIKRELDATYTAAGPSGQTLAGAGVEVAAFERWARGRFSGAEVFDRIESRPANEIGLTWEYNGYAVQSAWAAWIGRATLTTTSAGTTGNDSEDAARYRMIRNGLSDVHGDCYAMTFAADGDHPVVGADLDNRVDRMIERAARRAR